MKTQIEKLTGEFVDNLLDAIVRGSLGDLVGSSNGTKGKPRGMAALTTEQRSVVARKAASTRKHRAAARKAVATRQRNATAT